MDDMLSSWCTVLILYGQNTFRGEDGAVRFFFHLWQVVCFNIGLFVDLEV